MAPRTEVQQEAYNAKRRAESAAKKAPATPKGKPAAPKKASKTVVAGSRKGQQAKLTAAKKRKAELAVGPSARKWWARVGRSSKAKALKAKTNPYASPDDVVLSKAERKKTEADRKEEDLKARPVTIAEGAPSTHTMARSYLRSGAPGLGKLRGKTYQATVSFTESQMPQLVEAAKFRGVSLAEMIRSCVVEHLNKG